MKSLAVFLLFLSFIPGLASAQRITVKGNRFQVGGKEIWISGETRPGRAGTSSATSLTLLGGERTSAS